MTRGNPRSGNSMLAMVGVARIGVGAAMILAPDRFFRQGTGAETLLMQTVGIRDVVLGSGTCAALATGAAPTDFRRWATAGLVSDGADLALGLRSKSLVGSRSAWIAALSPVPFLAAEIFGLTR